MGSADRETDGQRDRETSRDIERQSG